MEDYEPLQVCNTCRWKTRKSAEYHCLICNYSTKEQRRNSQWEFHHTLIGKKMTSTISPDLCVTEPSGYSHSRWDALLDSTIAKIKSLSSLKGGEYAGDTDRLANFRRNAAALGLPMETVWAVYSAKHWDALMQYIKDLNEGKTRDRLEPISGRVDDLLVYLLLFKAMLEERE